MLSLPFAFAKVGIAGGVLIQSVSALASAYSLYIMISSARRTGATTYAKVSVSPKLTSEWARSQTYLVSAHIT